ncbi:chromosome partitioning protein ParB (plasmid) [Paroceanicella profunda]|uniref:Chromosome partitioning protein ParB n=1 Tax=Paroceanicella profunda TaxID=2579971 RepID=A0A5B8G3P3_9RHOB|nr:ParB N-terminal domain-containing protein [Paroceanicella profunda]QDL94590.1 chromosome partitioning protein ParB [Paroceanicella profunda]
MARRKRLEAPSAEDLAAFDESFAAKPVSGRPGMAAPIAQVAAEAAREMQPGTAADRERRARVEADASAWRGAMDSGRVLLDLPLDAVRADHITRDRVMVDHEEMEELKASLRAAGQRHPIEVVALGRGSAGEVPVYGLVSGWRRLTALHALRSETGDARFGTVRAILCAAEDAGAAYTAMVVENEVRAQLTPYERGRIAVVAAGQGAFASPEAAVDTIFAAASKAKRSKIRSFALVHEELGDLLAHPAGLSEKAGLHLAQALRQGFAAKLRTVLAEAHESGRTGSAEAEWQVLEAAMAAQAPEPQRPAKGGRPPSLRKLGSRVSLPGGIMAEPVRDAKGFAIRFHGEAMTEALLEDLMMRLATGKPGSGKG